jgi:DNA-binding LacI/PurR family transcriptional regulator
MGRNEKIIKPTIRDVAEHANVSVATVSRYLNNSPYIAKKSVLKVEKAIKELGYQPSIIAQGLNSGNTNVIALAVDDTNTETYGNDYFLRIQYGLERELARNGYYLMIIPVGGEKRGELEQIVKSGRIDGIVILNQLFDEDMAGMLEKYDFPLIVAGRTEIQNVLWIDIDNVEAGRKATSILIQAGAERIGFLTNSFDKLFAYERMTGFRKEMKKAGLKLHESEIVDQLNTEEDVINYIERNKNHLCSAYVASDSKIGFFLLRALKRIGKKVPEEIQVISFDDSILASLAEPSMTVINIDVAALGEKCADSILQEIQNGKVTANKLLPVSVIRRNTVR